jgi:hypothetical protein
MDMLDRVRGLMSLRDSLNIAYYELSRASNMCETLDLLLTRESIWEVTADLSKAISIIDTHIRKTQ